MGRFLMYATITLLAVFVLSATFVLDHGGGSTAAVVEVSVHDLLMTPERFRGDEVTTEGVLRFDSTTDGYLITADGQGIIVRFAEPELQLLRDQAVKVTGRFDYERDTGVYLEANVVVRVDS